VLATLEHLTEVAITSMDSRVPARLESYVNALDPKTRTALLRVIPEGEAPWLLVGSGVYVEFSVERSDGWNVPRDAIVYGVAAPRIYREKDGKVSPIQVEVLSTAADRALVKTAELRKGDRIVIRGNERLRPGQAVTEKGALVPKGTAQ
jgi:hypothetical protein